MHIYIYMNMIHDSIKCDHEKSTQSISFLDTLVYIDRRNNYKRKKETTHKTHKHTLLSP